MDQMMAFKTEETVDFYGVNAAWGLPYYINIGDVVQIDGRV
jgi:hypothetical protein